MKNNYPNFLTSALGAAMLLPPALATAQVPTPTNFTPGRNTASMSPITVGVTFSQPVTGSSGIRVFSSRWRGLEPGTTAGDGTTQFIFRPGQSFGPDELVSVTVPGTVRGTGTGSIATAGTVFQFRTRMVSSYTGQFVGTTSLLESGTSLFDPTLADVNGDGKLDLLLADAQNDRVRLRLGSSSGSLGPATLLSTGTQPTSIAVADMNNDGKLDLLTSTNTGTNRAVTVALGTGQGTFGPLSAVPVVDLPGQIRVGDVNADGNLDFVVTVVSPLAAPSGPSAVLVVRLGNGLGGFTAAPDVPVDMQASNLHLADFNNDGKLDCLVGSAGTNLLKTYLGNGLGGFALTSTSPLPLTGPTDVGDINSDGLLDLAMADNSGNVVRVYPGTGTGGFGPAVTLTVTGPLAVHIADVNSDGVLDVLATYNAGIGNAGLALWTNSPNTPGNTFTARLTPNCVGTALVTGMLGSVPGLVVVDDGVNGLSPNIKIRTNQVVLATRSAAETLPALLYPNPARGTVQLVLPTGAATSLHTKIYNTLGQLVREQHLPAQQPNTSAQLDISSLPAGLYTLRLTSATQTSSQQLVID